MQKDRGARSLELDAQRRRQRRGRLATQDDSLAAAAQAIERRGRLFAGAGGVGELLFGALTLGDEARRSARRATRRSAAVFALRASASPRRSASRARSRVAIAACRRAISSPSFSARSAAVAWSASGRRRLLHLVLEVARPLDLHGDAGELQLGAVASALEAAEARRLLDQLAPLVRLRVEHGLDTPLRDHRPETAAEADVGEQLDEVDAANRCLVDEVLALAAALQLARDRHLGIRQVGPGTVRVVEQEVDLAEIHRPRPTEPAKRTSSGFSARSSPGLSEPVAQRIESETFDLPDPFGPTTTETPGSRRISTGSTKDLNPRSLIAFRCTREEASDRPGWERRAS